MAIAWCLPYDGYGDGDCDGDGDGDDNVMLAAYSYPMIYAQRNFMHLHTPQILFISF